MSHRTYIGEIAEGTTPVITFNIVDEAGDGFKPSALALTLYDYRTQEVINSRDAQDVLDMNGVTVASDGVATWTTVEADFAMLNSARGREQRVALLEWSWAGGVKKAKHELLMSIVNLAQTP